MIAQTLQQKIGESMKANDEIRTSTLRLLLSAFNYEKIDKQRDLTDEEEVTVVRREVKQRRDSIEAYDKADRRDLSDKEKAEMAILSEYLPPEMSDDELVKLVDEAVAQIKLESIADMGKVIGFVKSKAPSADGGKIAEIVKGKLSK